jgi:regulator of replication initiation timing
MTIQNISDKELQQAQRIAELQAEVERLTPLQFRQAPCHKFCEATAFNIEIKQLRSQIDALKQMMQAEPVAWINWNAATGARTVSFEQESELASQPLYYTPVTGDDLAEMTDLKEEREHQRDSAVETVRELVKQRDALRAELGEYPEIQAMLMGENKQLRDEHLSATKPFEKYLKEGETPIQRLEREIKDGRALMTVYGKALAQIQELQQQQDTPVAFYDIAHDEDGEVEYEFSVYPRPGFKPLFAQAIAAPQAEPAWYPTQESIKALKRFEETFMDGEGYDVSKEVMRQLAMIGLVYHASAGRYGITDFGNSVLAAAPKGAV